METKAFTVRGLTADQLKKLDAIAAHRGVNRHQMVVDMLTHLIGENRPHILGWIKIDRWGEVDEREEFDDATATCPECSQDINTAQAYIGLLDNGQHYGPVCAGCATSE